MLYGAQKRLTEGCFFSTDSQSPPAENYYRFTKETSLFTARKNDLRRSRFIERRHGSKLPFMFHAPNMAFSAGILVGFIY